MKTKSVLKIKKLLRIKDDFTEKFLSNSGGIDALKGRIVTIGGNAISGKTSVLFHLLASLSILNKTAYIYSHYYPAVQFSILDRLNANQSNIVNICFSQSSESIKDVVKKLLLQGFKYIFIDDSREIFYSENPSIGSFSPKIGSFLKSVHKELVDADATLIISTTGSKVPMSNSQTLSLPKELEYFSSLVIETKRISPNNHEIVFLKNRFGQVRTKISLKLSFDEEDT